MNQTETDQTHDLDTQLFFLQTVLYNTVTNYIAIPYKCRANLKEDQEKNDVDAEKCFWLESLPHAEP